MAKARRQLSPRGEKLNHKIQNTFVSIKEKVFAFVENKY
jgi:hypothetical protein